MKSSKNWFSNLPFSKFSSLKRIKEVGQQRRRQNKSTHCAAAAFADLTASNTLIPPPPQKKKKTFDRGFRVRAFTQ